QGVIERRLPCTQQPVQAVAQVDGIRAEQRGPPVRLVLRPPGRFRYERIARDPAMRCLWKMPGTDRIRMDAGKSRAVVGENQPAPDLSRHEAGRYQWRWPHGHHLLRQLRNSLV